MSSQPLSGINNQPTTSSSPISQAPASVNPTIINTDSLGRDIAVSAGTLLGGITGMAGGPFGAAVGATAGGASVSSIFRVWDSLWPPKQ